ncbi:MAG: hypothetical protein LC109_10050 [Bacteroidia bacterium]|nr:hypothetical protein [Bacteroidia bacterium]
MKEKLDGQIFLDAADLPTREASQTDEVIWESDETIPYEIVTDVNLNSEVIFERLLAKWVDPTTPPQIRNKCVKMCGAGPFRTCCGWKLQKKWYYRKATLIVSTKEPADIKKAIEGCIKVAAIAAAIAAIVSGGSAAAAVAESMLTSCLAEKLGSNLASVRISLNGGWGDWE